jgi:hypothetical protein
VTWPPELWCQFPQYHTNFHSIISISTVSHQFPQYHNNFHSIISISTVSYQFPQYHINFHSIISISTVSYQFPQYHVNFHSISVEIDMIQQYYNCSFNIRYYILNALVCILPGDGRYLPKHVAGIKKSCLYVRYVQWLVFYKEITVNRNSSTLICKVWLSKGQFSQNTTYQRYYLEILHVKYSQNRRKNVQKTGKISFTPLRKLRLLLHLSQLTHKWSNILDGDILHRILNRSANKRTN